MVTTRRGIRVGIVSSDESHGTTLGTSPPLFEVLDTRKLVFFLALAVQAVSLWFVSAGTVRISSAGISPFDLMKYYVVGCSWVMILFLYTISRWFNPSYAARVAALSIGGFWFQLHLCPQSLELIPFLGFIFIFVKIAVDKRRQNLWTILAISTIPVFVVSHPETGAVVLLGLGGLIFLSRAVPFLAWLRAKTRLPGLSILSRILPDGQKM